MSTVTDDAPPPHRWTFPRRVGLVAVAAAALLLVGYLADVLLLVFGGIVLATVLRGLANLLRRRLRLPEAVSVVASVLVIAAIMVAVGWFAGDALADQVTRLRERVPQAWTALTGWLGRYAIGRAVLELMLGVWDNEAIAGQVTRYVTMTMHGAGIAILMLFVAIYFASEPQLYRRGVVRLVPPAHRERVDAALGEAGHGLSRWLLGQSVSMLFLGVTTGVGLALLGAPLAPMLGLLTGLLAFVPFFGALIAGVLAVLLAFVEGPRMALHVAILFVVVQQVEEYVLLPFVQRWAVKLPPVLGLVAALVFGLLFGPLGVLFATPLMVVAMILVRRLYVEDVLEHADDAPPAPPSVRSLRR